MFFIVNAARWAWRKVKSAIIFLFGGSETESAAQEKTDEGTQETSTAREQNDSSSWGRAKTKARHAWLFLSPHRRNSVPRRSENCVLQG